MADSCGSRPSDPKVVVWTELQVPTGEELDTNRWDGYFQPLLHAPGHRGSGWARVQGRPHIIILATLWYTTSELRDFTDSPSAQLFRENLESRAIMHISSRETIYRGLMNWFPALQKSYVQLFWVYFSTPVTEAQKSQIAKLKGIRPYAMGPGIPINKLLQRHVPEKLWATQTEYLHSQETQLMLWPHFWWNAEKAKFRYTTISCSPYIVEVENRTRMEGFSAKLEELGPLDWKEDICDFKPLHLV